MVLSALVRLQRKSGAHSCIGARGSRERVQADIDHADAGKKTMLGTWRVERRMKTCTVG